MLTEIYPSLFLLREESPGAPSQFVYLLRYGTGVALFGTKADLSAHFAELSALGRITHVLLGDRHHVTEHTALLAKHFDVPISASEIEASALRGITVGAIVPFRRTQIMPGLEAIPTPGHTRGALSFLWTRKGRRFLFVGDTIVPIDGEWHYWVSKANRAIMRESMRQLATLDADVILSNSFAATPKAWVEVSPLARAQLFAGLDRRLAP
jgi:glyoxylase-like metal-dependent hydrolase (beta-lactamase superfamily II)